MLGRMYANQICSVAWTLEIVGERWSLLILRDAIFAGVTRFSDFQRNLGIAPNILTKRLESFVEQGVFTKTEEDEYRVTSKGLDFKPVIMALREWGDRWAAPEGPPAAVVHDGCGGKVELRMHCRRCSHTPGLKDIKAQATKAFTVYQDNRTER